LIHLPDPYSHIPFFEKAKLCRKITMQKVITGTKIDFREITGFCDVELFGGNPEVKRIGFGR